MLPTLYVSHGSPILALEPGASGVQLRRLATELPQPKAILVVSVHWKSDDLRVTGAAAPDIWHDFHNFPPPLYAVCYPARDAPALAQRTIELLQAAGLPTQADPQQPFDRGTWVPLNLMYPQTGVPVLQLFLSSHLDPALQSRVGQTLRRLHEEGVLLIGSGSTTHNLSELNRHAGPEAIAPWAQGSRDWMVGKFQADDRAALHDYRRQAPWTARNYPSDEHLLPLFFARGVGDGGVRAEHSGFTLDSLGMGIYHFD